VHENKITRLTDILTKEVSLVDRAANKRRFLLTKADEGESMSVALVSDGQGGFVTPAPEAAAARPQLVEVVEKLTALANAPVPAGGEAEVAKAVSDIVAPLVIAAGVAEAAAEAPKAETADFAPLLKADSATVRKMVFGALAKLAEVANSLGAEVEEDPSETCYKIMGALSGMVELARIEQAAAVVAAMPSPAAKAEDSADAVVKAVDSEKFRGVAASLKKSLDSIRGIADDTGVSKPTDFNPDTAAKLLDDATQVIKSLTGRITALEGTVVSPNALPVEGVTKSAGPVVWPLDMNEPSEVVF
jgi:hypothetical protein